jgi:glycosyltransferase involved in cell wall biosynthesis
VKKVLNFFLASADHYRKTMFSNNEIFVGPDCETTWDGETLLSLKIAPGKIEINTVLEIIEKLPQDQTPELIVVKADATRRVEVLGLKECGIETILIAGNTQHGQNPIEYLTSYAKEQDFSYIISDHKKHHLHWFAKAGIPTNRLFFIPALNINTEKCDLEGNRKGILFFGGVRKDIHPFRYATLTKLKADITSLEILQGNQERGPQLYNSHLINLNISLNADLNLRVFEIIAAGGFLLTDRLSADSGLFECFEEGVEFEAFGSYEELLEKINFYEANPEKALEIAKAGYNRFWKDHSPEKKFEAFWSIVEGVAKPFLKMEGDDRCVELPQIAFENRLSVYEELQDIHRQNSLVNIFVTEEIKDLIKDDYRDLSRIKEASLEDADTLILSTKELSKNSIELSSVSAQNAIVYVEDSVSAESYLSPFGFEKISEELFVRAPEYLAEKLIEAGNRVEGFKLLKNQMVSGNLTARLYYDMAMLSNSSGDAENGTTFIKEALALDSNHLPSLISQAQILLNSGDARSAIYTLQHINAISPNNPNILTPLGQTLLSENLIPEAITAFRNSLEVNPDQAETAKQLEELIQLSLLPSRRPKIHNKKILLVTNIYPPQELGGYGRLMFDFMEILKSRGHTVEVLTSDTPYLGDVDKNEVGVYRELELFGEWEGGKARTYTRDVALPIARADSSLVETHLERFRPDLVMLGNIDFIGQFLMIPIADRNIPMIHHNGNRIPGYGSDFTPPKNLYRAATCSGWLRDHFWREGHKLEKIDVVYPGAKVNMYYRETLPEINTLKIVFAGIILPYKGPQFLVEAVIKLHKAGIPFELTFAGTSTDEEFLNSLKNRVAEEGIEDNVRFTGFLTREKLKNVFWKNSVFVHPSKFEEPFGISQVEAMAAGLVSITSATGGAGEVNEHGDSGLHFITENSDSLAEQLTYLHNNHSEWNTLRRAGQKRAIDLFDIEKSVDKLEEIYSEMEFTTPSEPTFTGSTALTFSSIKRKDPLYLYAGDVPVTMSQYDKFVGLSLSQSNERHINFDVTKRHDLPDNCVNIYQSEDVFEHIEIEDMPKIINEIYRLLKPGGIFRLSIPDYGCDILKNRSLTGQNGEIMFDPGGGGNFVNGKVVDGGHVWFPLYSTLKEILEKTSFENIRFYHYYDEDEKPVTLPIDYSIGYIQRVPDHDKRVQNPFRPMSIVVDCIK